MDNDDFGFDSDKDTSAGEEDFSETELKGIGEDGIFQEGATGVDEPFAGNTARPDQPAAGSGSTEFDGDSPEGAQQHAKGQIFEDGYLSEAEIHALAEEMRIEFGLRELDAHELPGLDNAAEHPGENEVMSYDDQLIYDSDFIVKMAQKHGKDVVAGIIGHEIGHCLVKTGVSDHEQEYTADVVSGMLSARRGCSPDAMEHFYLSPEVRAESESHPHGLFRMAKFREGFELAQDNPELSLRELIDRTSVADNFCRANLRFDAFFDKHERIIADNDETEENHSLKDDDIKEVFPGKPQEEISFGGGLGYCNIKCMQKSDDFDTYVPSSDWSGY